MTARNAEGRFELAIVAILALASACSSRGVAPVPRDAGPDASATASALPTPPLASVAPGAREPARVPSEPRDDPERACAAFASLPVPPEDEPALAETRALAGCDSEALYYGIGVARDFPAARRCAYAERRARTAPVIGGSAVLMMIYANARGVRRNVALASKFACELGGSGVELEARLARLESWRTIRESRELDVCDHITSGYMDGICTAHRERIAALARNERRAAARAGLPEPELARLERAATAYFAARAANEIDLSGSSRAAFQLAERAALEDLLLDALERVKRPGFPPSRDAAAEVELEAVYDALMHCGSRSPSGGLGYTTVRREGVQSTHRLWLSFREAWVLFGEKARPEAAPDVFRRWLARERTKALSELAEACRQSATGDHPAADR